VETIYLKEDYHGYSRFYSDDIAFIVLSNRANISSAVAPVCVDWNGRYNVTNGIQGKVSFFCENKYYSYNLSRDKYYTTNHLL
jgi:hypothetical protein